MANKMSTQTQTHGSNDKVVPSDHKYNENEIRAVPLDQIEVDADWNARSFASVMGPDAKSDDKEAKGLEIKDSIRVKGQDTPVTLTPNILGMTPAGKKTDRPFFLVAGFCRMAAIQTLNADEFVKAEAKANGRTVVPNTANGTIRAVIRVLDQKEARSFNVRENTARKALETKDTVHAVHDMFYVQKKSAHEISLDLGMTTGYVQRLVNIAGLKPAILKHWRNGGKIKGTETEVDTNVDVTSNGGIKVLEEIAKLDADRQVDAYIALLLPKEEGAGGDNDNQWIEAGKKKAHQLGFMLGMLQQNEFLEVAADDAAWAAVISQGWLKVTGRKEFSAAIAKKFAKEAMAGYAEGLEFEPEAEEGEETETAAKGKGKGKK